MIKAIRRSTALLGLVAGLVLVAGASDALAGRNSVSLSVPYAKHKVPYYITVTGNAAGLKHPHVFIDTRKCGATPAVEFSRTGHPYGSSFGYYVKKVSGSFSRVAGFRTKRRTMDHACAYLVSYSTQENAKGGVVARTFRRYLVH
jgi:hypothetical protein